MRIAVVSDESHPVNAFVVEELERTGHSVLRFGSLADGKPWSYVEATAAAARAVAEGRCDEGVFFCWTGTGASIAANKIAGIRAALCHDAPSAETARVWNHANVLVLSNRSLSRGVAQEIMATWLQSSPNDPRGRDAVEAIQALEHD